MAVRLSPQQEKKILAQKGTTKAPKAKKTKYGNKKITYDGKKFASEKEANRYLFLKKLEKDGVISDLVCHPYWYLVKGVKFSNEKRAKPALKYTADFAYFDANGNYVVEDVKSPATRKEKSYRMRRHLMLAIEGIEVVEV